VDKKNLEKIFNKNLEKIFKKNLEKIFKKKSIVGGNKHIETFKKYIDDFKENPKKYIGHPSSDFELCKKYNKDKEKDKTIQQQLTIKNLPDK